MRFAVIFITAGRFFIAFSNKYGHFGRRAV
jgi:hypothetical protein